MSPSCLRFAPMLSARKGELPAADEAALHEHLAGCDACQARLADGEVVGGMVSEALLAEAALVGVDFAPFVDQVMARVEPGGGARLPALAAAPQGGGRGRRPRAHPGRPRAHRVPFRRRRGAAAGDVEVGCPRGARPRCSPPRTGRWCCSAIPRTATAPRRANAGSVPSSRRSPSPSWPRSRPQPTRPWPVRVRIIQGSRQGPAQMDPRLQDLAGQLGRLAYQRWTEVGEHRREMTFKKAEQFPLPDGTVLTLTLEESRKDTVTFQVSVPARKTSSKLTISKDQRIVHQVTDEKGGEALLRVDKAVAVGRALAPSRLLPADQRRAPE